ncbi:unnamed protein product [Effrenium voratum]|uniref:Uncharacterized protein n=1 Tax=Effrenium voratum TaxID=2562239 RepID=A0AA36JG75_9DINO|nr:unnamed protein product [Effrenium voratum]CAJ1446539.1 unnamed protein product [Effrenium voratum]
MSDAESSASGDSSSSRSRSRGRAEIAVGCVVEIHGLEKSVELNGQEGVAVSCSAGRWAVLLRDEARKVSVPSEQLRRRQLGPQEVRLRFCNVPEGYDSALMRQELEDECFGEDAVLSVVHDTENHHCYITAASQAKARQIVLNFDGRRLERLGPGLLPESCLRQNVKLEWL